MELCWTSFALGVAAAFFGSFLVFLCLVLPILETTDQQD